MKSMNDDSLVQKLGRQMILDQETERAILNKVEAQLEHGTTRVLQGDVLGALVGDRNGWRHLQSTEKVQC